MAVFPDRIVLKSSADAETEIVSAISGGSPDEIVPGELVISRQDGAVNLLTLDSNGNVVSASVPALSGLSDIDLDTPVPDNSILKYNAETGKWENADAPPFDISGNDLGDLGDVTLSGAVADKSLLTWSASDSEWVNRLLPPQDLYGISQNRLTNQSNWTYETGMVLRWNDAVPSPDDSLVPGIGGAIGWELSKMAYSDIEGAPQSLSDLNIDLSIGDLNDVNLTGPNVGDLIAWDGSQWSTVPAPPVDLSGGSLDDLGDVDATSKANTSVPVYNQNSGNYEIRPVQYADISSRPTSLSDLGNDLSVSDFPNDAGYITSTDGLDTNSLSDVTITNAQEGQMLLYRSGFWVNEFGPPANISMSSIGELKDVTYFQPGVQAGVLTIENMGSINLDSPEIANGFTFDFGYNSTYGIGMEALRDSDSTGSAVYAARDRGITLRADVNIVRLTGRPTVATNRPELRFETGDSGASTPTGEYIGFKMPQTVYESTTYILPDRDGDTGDILATNGLGGLVWTAPQSAGALGDLSDVDLATIPPSNNEGLVYNGTTGLWMPGKVSNVDLGASSIDELSDVNTSAVPPEAGQALVWNDIANVWRPADVATDLESSSIGDLGDVKTSGEGHAPQDGQALVWSDSMNHWMPADVGGGGIATGRTTEVLTTDASGYGSFGTFGFSGLIMNASLDADAWLSFYTSEGARAADASRQFTQDPTPGSGVVCEMFIAAGGTVLATPGTPYLNADAAEAEILYVSTRTKGGAAVAGVEVTATVYKN